MLSFNNIFIGYSLKEFIYFAIFLFLIAIFGIFITRKNIITILICLEILFLAVNLNFIFFSVFLDDFWGQAVALYVLAVAAAESALGLALLISFYRLRRVIALDFISSLKG